MFIILLLSLFFFKARLLETDESDLFICIMTTEMFVPIPCYLIYLLFVFYLPFSLVSWPPPFSAHLLN